MHAVRVVVVDDHEIVRAGLVALLSREPNVHVVGVASSGEEALEVVAEVEPQIAVIDYSMPGMSGVELCEALNKRHPDVRVIMLTSFVDDDVVLRAVNAGVLAYVYKDVDGTELTRAIRNVARGRSVIDPAVTKRVLRWAHRQRHGTGDEALSLREIEVLRLVNKGMTNKDIAHELFLSQNTVRTYLRRVSLKLDSHSRTESAALAAQRGLL